MDTLGLCPPGRVEKWIWEPARRSPQALPPSAASGKGRKSRRSSAPPAPEEARSLRKADAGTICIVNSVSKITGAQPGGLGTGKATCGRGRLSPLGSDEECGTNQFLFHGRPSWKNFLFRKISELCFCEKLSGKSLCPILATYRENGPHFRQFGVWAAQSGQRGGQDQGMSLWLVWEQPISQMVAV